MPFLITFVPFSEFALALPQCLSVTDVLELGGIRSRRAIQFSEEIVCNI